MDSKDAPTPQLTPGRENLAPLDYASTRYDARIPTGVSKDDVLRPEFWAHHAKDLRPFDEIRARAVDGSWVSYLMVLDCSRTWARVMQMNHYNLTSSDIAMTQSSEQEVAAMIAAHEVRYRGAAKFSVIRKSDEALIKDGIASKAEAQTWLENHARTMIGAPAKLQAVPA